MLLSYYATRCHLASHRLEQRLSTDRLFVCNIARKDNIIATRELLGIPEEALQVALLPVAYTLGTEFKSATRPPPDEVIHWDHWGD